MPAKLTQDKKFFGLYLQSNTKTLLSEEFAFPIGFLPYSPEKLLETISNVFSFGKHILIFFIKTPIKTQK